MSVRKPESYSFEQMSDSPHSLDFALLIFSLGWNENHSIDKRYETKYESLTQIRAITQLISRDIRIKTLQERLSVFKRILAETKATFIKKYHRF
jgi:hypothetical protein